MELKDKIFLYILMKNSKPVYVGISSNILYRYQKHCANINENELPDIILVDNFSNIRDAKIAETALIKYHLSVGNKLCNGLVNPVWNRIKFSLSSPQLNRKKLLWANDIVENAFNKFETLTGRLHFNDKIKP